jgi:hypothetical protein
MSSCAHAIPFQKSIGRRISAMSSGKLDVPESAKALPAGYDKDQPLTSWHHHTVGEVTAQ